MHTISNWPLEVVGCNKAELAFKKEKDTPIFRNMIDSWLQM